MFEVKGVSLRAIRQLDLTIEAGEYVAVAGLSGSGKTTLVRLLNGLWLPARGRVTVAGMDTADAAAHLPIRQKVAMVFQNPESQFVAQTVESELAFGPENLGLERAEIERRVETALDLTGLTRMRYRDPQSLSGGQKQVVALGGVLAMMPEALLLDEATSMLDPIGRRRLLDLVESIRRERGLTVITVTHNPEQILRAERCLILEEGRLRWDSGRQQGEAKSWWGPMQGARLGLPPMAELELRMQDLQLPSLASEEFWQRLTGPLERTEDSPKLRFEQMKDGGRGTGDAYGPSGPVIEVDGLNHVYMTGTPLEQTSLQGISFTVKAGQRVALMGGAGSGKSTLLSHLNGLTPAQSGSVTVEGRRLDGSKARHWVRRRVGILFQFSEHQLFGRDAVDDVGFGPRQRGLKGEPLRQLVERCLKTVGLDPEQWGRPLIDLSGGERRLVALAGVLAQQPSILLLDEPTAGLDHPSRCRLYETLERLSDQGKTVLLVSHDPDEVAMLAQRVLVLFEGRLVADLTPAELFLRSNLEQWRLDHPALGQFNRRFREAGHTLEPVPLTVDAAESVLRERLRTP